MDLEVVRGDTLRFAVANGSAIGSGVQARLELRRHPADAYPLASLSRGDGITASGSTWQIEVPESTAKTLAQPGRPAVCYWQLRTHDGTDGRTLEQGVIRVLRDPTRMGDAWQPASGTGSLGDQGGF